MKRINLLLLGVALGVATCVSAAPQTAVKAQGTQSYELKEFFADFTHFTIGDTVPEMYRTEEYNIKQWKQRNLPAPDAGSHWTYMGGNYVLITDAEGKILKVYDGEIFYHR